jgi:hypothetical protein
MANLVQVIALVNHIPARLGIARVSLTQADLVLLSRGAWVLVGGDPEDEERVLPRPKGRSSILVAGLKLARDDVEETDDNRGGREADPRLRAFVSSLGMIYENIANKELTYKVDPASGELTSPFGRFVLEALRLFYPKSEVPIGTVRILVQHLAQFKAEPAKRGRPRKSTLP